MTHFNFYKPEGENKWPGHTPFLPGTRVRYKNGHYRDRPDRLAYIKGYFPSLNRSDEYREEHTFDCRSCDCFAFYMSYPYHVAFMDGTATWAAPDELEEVK